MSSSVAVATISADARESIGRMLARALDDPSLELEARLGQWSDGSFLPGVSRDHMDQLVRLLDGCSGVEPNAMGWVEEDNYIFRHNGTRHRTRVRYDYNDLKLSSHTIVKTTLEALVLRTRVMDVRIALSQETTVASRDLPVATTTEHARIKQLRSYHVCRSPFRIDCGMVWSGTTRSDAELCQRGGAPVYEVECELAPHDDARAQWKRRYTNGSGYRVAALVDSFVYKLSDLMFTPGIHFESTGTRSYTAQ